MSKRRCIGTRERAEKRARSEADRIINEALCVLYEQIPQLPASPPQPSPPPSPPPLAHLYTCIVCDEHVAHEQMVCCVACNQVACTDCYKSYLVNTSASGVGRLPRCMFTECGQTFTFADLVNWFGSAWVDTTLKPIRTEAYIATAEAQIDLATSIVVLERAMDMVKLQQETIASYHKTVDGVLWLTTTYPDDPSIQSAAVDIASSFVQHDTTHTYLDDTPSFETIADRIFVLATEKDGFYNHLFTRHIEPVSDNILVGASHHYYY